MFELLLGTEFFLPRRFVASANHNITGWIAIHKQQRYFAQEIFFLSLEIWSAQKRKETNKQKKKNPKKTEYNNKANNKVSKSNLGVCRSQLLVSFALKF